MIPTATTMEIKYGLICNSNEFLLLGSTESLLKILGFELCNSVNDDDGAAARQTPSFGDFLKASDNTQQEKIGIDQLSDALVMALNDVRDLRHRIKEDQKGKDGKTLSRREKRMNHKVDSLEKQRAKLLEKQYQNGAEHALDSKADIKNSIEIHYAWSRIARTFNSVRLLLFLFSEEKGLDILSRNVKKGKKKDKGIKDIAKHIQKLSETLEVMVVSSPSIGNSTTAEDDHLGMTMDTIISWGKSVNATILSRRKNKNTSIADNDNNYDDDVLVNDSVIELTDDSSSDSNGNHNENRIDNIADSIIDLTDDSSSGSKVDKNDDKDKISTINDADPAIGDDDSSSSSASEEFETNENDARGSNVSTLIEVFKSSNLDVEQWLKILSFWNNHIDRLMADMISKMSMDSSDEVASSLDKAFDALSLDDGNSELDTISVYERAKQLDEKFFLIVGVTGSAEYKIRQKYLLSIEKLRHRIEQRIRQGNRNNPFEDARLDVYGSCLSGLSLGKNADVDLSLTFPEAIEKKKDFEAGNLTAKKYSRHVTDMVYKIKRKLESSRPLRQRRSSGSEEFRGMEAIPRARVPVIKGIYTDADNPHSEDGSLHFDICLLNDIAVANSGLIKEYSDVDIRVKSLMIAIKRWAKDNNINAAHENTLSSYTWMNMVIFFLQSIEFVPNLQCPILMKECNYGNNSSRVKRRQDNINNLDTAYLKWKGQADRVWKRDSKVDDAFPTVSLLLYGFFRFYSQIFPMHLHMVSIKRGGKAQLPKTMFPDRTSLHICIEDPFETYDSHFPHDLGMPADEAGSIFISKCFRDSTEHIERILFGKAKQEGEDNVEKIKELWPILTPTNELGRSRRQRKTKPEKRDPNSTLVIEIGGRGVKKDQLLKLFRPFADETKSNIIGSHLTGSGRLAFVDYDSVAAVHAALAAHARKPLVLNSYALSISQKTQSLSKQVQQQSGGDQNNTKKPNEVEKTVKNEPKNEEKNDPKKSNNNDTIPSSDVGKSDSPKKTKNTKGDPEKTLVVQNFRGSVSEVGLAKLFRPFADQTSSKLLSADLVKKKTTAFIEYDSPAAVQAALKEHSEKPLKWNGKILDVAQKLPTGWKRREKLEREKQRAKVEEVTVNELEAVDGLEDTTNQTKDSQPVSPKNTKRKTPKKGGKKNKGNQKGAAKEPGQQQERQGVASSPAQKSGGNSSRGKGGRRQGRKKPQATSENIDSNKQVVETNKPVEEQL